jgi:hypothetical protein
MTTAEKATEQPKPSTRERKLLESESRWLQKALFALSKADDDREKLATVGSSGFSDGITVRIDGKSVAIEAVSDAVRDAVDDRMEELRTVLRKDRRSIAS